MATELVWKTDANRVNPQFSSVSTMSKYQIWYMAQVLIGNIGGFTQGLWTVLSSSDGSTANSNDNWGGGTFNATNFTRNTTGNAHSWITLKSPDTLTGSSGNYIYFTLDYSSDADHKLNYAFSSAEPTGGSTTARPSSSVEWTYTNNILNDASVSTSHRLHTSLSSRGDFVIFANHIGGQRFKSVQSLFKLKETSSADLNPWVSLFTVDDDLFYWNRIGNAQYGVSGVRAITHDGINAPNTWGLTRLSTFYGNYFGASLQNNGAPMAGPSNSDGKYMDAPAYVISHTTYIEKKGRIPDLLLAPGNLPQGAVRSSTKPYEYVKFGHVWLPWNSSQNPLL